MAKNKRKNFIKVFIPKFLISIPIVIVIFIITITFMNMRSESALKKNNEIYSTSRMDKIEEYLSENSFAEEEDHIGFLLRLYQSSSVFAWPGYKSIAYIEDENGEVVLDSEKALQILIIDKNKDADNRLMDVYTCDLDYLQSIPEFADLLKYDDEYTSDTLLEFFLPKKIVDCYPVILTGYADPETHNFYVGKCIFPYYETKMFIGYESEESRYGEPYKKILVDLTPEDVSGFLEYNSASDSASIPDENSTTKYFDGELVSSFTILCGGKESVKDVTSKVTYLDHLSHISKQVKDVNGDTYTVHFMISDNFTKAYMSVMIIIALIYLFIDAGFVLIISKISYEKLKGFYRNEDYRKALMSSMAHDLKTPLTVMSGYAENLKENVQTEKREHYADAILENTNYMNGIITDVLGLAKLEEETAKSKTEKLNFCEIAKAQAERIKPLLEEKNITLTVDGSFNRKADRASLERVMDNLLSNAVKYTKDGGNVNVYAKDTPFSKHVFVIENTPIDAIDVKPSKLWEPFVKGDQSRSDKSGTGLGLSIVKNILDNMGFKSKIKIKDGWFRVIIK